MKYRPILCEGYLINFAEDECGEYTEADRLNFNFKLAGKRARYNDGNVVFEDLNVELCISQVQSLDTPYMTTKMQSEGVYEDFVSYMDEKLEYDRLQRELETQRQIAFAESGMENYDEWLAEQPMMLPVENEPQPSEALLKFKEKYLG